MFGWRRRQRGRHHAREGVEYAVEEWDDAAEEDAPLTGPFDSEEAPDDGVSRLDLGSVRIPLPDGAQLQVEVDPAGPVRAVHLLTPVGRLTINAYAAPRSSGLWGEVSRELMQQLRQDGARVRREQGEWGDELVVVSPQVTLRFIGVDRPRWLLRAVGAGPSEHAEQLATLLRDVVRDTVVVRGKEPLPVRTPLPIELPDQIARHLRQMQQAQQAQPMQQAQPIQR